MTTDTEATPFEDVDEETTPVDELENETLGQKLLRYANLRALQKAKQAESDAAKLEANALQEQILEGLDEAQQQSVKLTDGRTVYKHTDVRASRNRDNVDEEGFLVALTEAGEGHLIKPTVNARSLEARVRELIKDDDGHPTGDLPEGLRDVINVHLIPSVRIKAS